MVGDVDTPSGSRTVPVGAAPYNR